MRRLPKEEREQIELQVEGFKKTKRDFEREVLKWDDRGNDIIVLAKKMCMIMMEMTDFTRQETKDPNGLFNNISFSGRGPLRTTMDVINAAKMISECGTKLNKLARDIAAQVSRTERSIKIFLFSCHSVSNLNRNLIQLLMLIVSEEFSP